jgi:hypothetical protein
MWEEVLTRNQDSPTNPPMQGGDPRKKVSRIISNNGTKEETMILVAGPTNQLGYEICYILASQGKSIRALVLDTSDPVWVERLKNFGATLAKGDLNDPVFLADAYVGVHEVICSPIDVPFEQPGGNHFKNLAQPGVLALMDAAKQAGVVRFVYLSFSNNASNNTDRGFPPGKQAIEQSLIESGIPYTILYAGEYRSQVQPVSQISSKDLARLATQALENPALRNTVVDPVMPAASVSNHKRTLETKVR